MNADISPASGRVASLHLHPEQPGAPLRGVATVMLVEGRGIEGDTRYFDRLSRDTGKPARRQVTLIEREQIGEHASAMGMDSIPPGAVRSNIETEGINLIALVGQEIEIGEATLWVYAPRDPCAKMDAICQGLRQKMENGRQGVLAEIRRSGHIRVGDSIRVLTSPPP